MENNRALIFYTFYILKKYASEKRPLEASEIARYIKNEFNFTKEPDKRTITGHIELLKDLPTLDMFNYEILEDEMTQAHYLLADITNSEIKLLCDVVSSSRFINKTQSEDLIKKLSVMCGDDFSPKYHTRLQFKSTNSTLYNSGLFANIEYLSEAIDKNKKVRFQYLKYNVDKKLVPSNSENDGYKTVQPYYLIWAINHYYLMCRYENTDTNRFLRVDKIRNVTIIDNKVDPLPETFNIHDYTRNQAFMFGGKNEPIRFRCEMRMLGQVIDFFGEDVEIKPIDQAYFDVRIETSIESIRYWVLQYITAIDNIRPEKLHEIIVADLEDALKRNKKESTVHSNR